VPYDPESGHGSDSHGDDYNRECDSNTEKDAFESVEFVAGSQSGMPFKTKLRGDDSCGGDHNHAAKAF